MKNVKFKLAVMTAAPIATMFLANSANADEQYTVQSGDTLQNIAANFGTSASAIAAANDIQDANNIYVGQQLTIPSDNDVQENYKPATTTQKSSASTTAKASTTPASTSSAKEWIANKESGGSYSARNGRYIGRYQLDASYLNGDYSAENQERVANKYVNERYGGWEGAKAFWQANGWY